MAKQIRTTLKGYFQTGNIPVEQHYIDFIDSTLNFSESNTGDINLIGNITSSGNISASGETGQHTFGGTIFDIKGNVSASGDISSSALVTAKNMEIYGNITASGNIKCGNFDVGGSVSAQNVDYTYISSSKITVVGPVTSTTLDTGQGANELYKMDQNVRTIDAVTFATVDTGQGANELYDMDQNVKTTSTPAFSGLNLGNTLVSARNWTNGKFENTDATKFHHQLTLNNVPVINPSKGGIGFANGPEIFTIQSANITAGAIIIATTSVYNIHAFINIITVGEAGLSLGTTGGLSYGGGTVVVNFAIMNLA